MADRDARQLKNVPGIPVLGAAGKMGAPAGDGVADGGVKPKKRLGDALNESNSPVYTNKKMQKHI